MTRARSRALALAPALAAVFALASPVRAQAPGSGIPPADSLVRVSAAPVRIAPGGAARARVRLAIAHGWHINANPASPDYMIATAVTLAPAGGVSAGVPRYPAAQKLRVEFDASTIAAWNGEVEIELPLTAAAGAAPGSASLAGTVRFQSCNDRVCLAPASVKFALPVTVSKDAAPGASGAGAAGPATGSAVPAPAPSAGFATGPPPAGAASGGGRLAEALKLGGLRWLLVLFVGGLLLNLTPCVFPMLGVTVSIFGARRAEPLPRVLANAVAYVLGIVIMYSALGAVAGLTGSLFGAALQSPWVSVGLGVLLVVLSLSMFGLYELQPPAGLLQALGGAGTSSLAGLFLSGLGVGIIAAPCVGPFVVAVLALIATRQDVGFGLRTMFTLALGLGAPYLVLATFSNLLQRLPRSGDWMVWVKQVFGVILASVGLFYALLGVAPRLAAWVPAAGLVLGGLYLGFLAPGASPRPGVRPVQRLLGLAALVLGLALILTAPRGGVAFREFSPARLEAALAAGRPVMIEFSADWCVPCHELERSTFSDRRVVAASGAFAAFKVDFTRYDSPAAAHWREGYRVAGVPTVLFLGPGGREIAATRVEGFIPPAGLLERMAVARGAATAGE